MNKPQQLQKGDTIAIVSPGKGITAELIAEAKYFWEQAGFQVKLGKYVAGSHNYFSGSDAERLSDFQSALNDDEVKAIVCARGGYGCVRLVDRLNWSVMVDKPKWIIGFSDVTVFLQHLNRMGVIGVHGTMPLNYSTNSEVALNSVVSVITGEKMNYTWSSDTVKDGQAIGRLLGGNLAVLTGLVGTNSMPDYSGAIMFVEEVGEHLYAIDRMFYTLSKSGILDKLSGLIVGNFSSVKDTEIPFGKTLQEIILEHFKYRPIPVAFDFPAGHCDDNRALMVGQEVVFSVQNTNCSLSSAT
jgi:muramoyltetrapeptide carboxypeptidase